MPAALRWVSYLAGSAWPDGDETALYGVQQQWERAADELAAVVPQVDRLRTQLAGVLSGETATAAQARFEQLFAGEQSMGRLAQAVSGLGELAGQGGAEIEYTKLQIISTLAIAAAEIAYALQSAWATFGSSLAWIAPVEAITMASIR